MIVFIVLGNMHLGGCGYHFAQETPNYMWTQLPYNNNKGKLLIHGLLWVGSEGFSRYFERTHHRRPGESAESEVTLLQGERVCSRKTAGVRWLLFLWCRLVTFWWLGSDVVRSASFCLLSDLESIVFSVNGAVQTWTSGTLGHVNMQDYCFLTNFKVHVC